MIEDPPYVQNQKTYKVLCAYLGCVLATIAEYTGGYGDEVEVSIANNKTTKKKLLGDGNASKTDVWKYVMGGTLLGVSPSIQDEADAGLYALLGG